MATLGLVRFLLESAEELIVKAEMALPGAAAGLLDEAEELLTLGTQILGRYEAKITIAKEAA